MFYEQISAKPYGIGYHGGIQAIAILAIDQNHFEILTWESMGKSSTVKAADRRAKRNNFFLQLVVLGSAYVLHIR